MSTFYDKPVSQYKDKTITAIRLFGSAIPASNVFHWCLSLTLDEVESFIIVDPTPTVDLKIVVMMSTGSYNGSPNEGGAYQTDVAQALTVSDLKALIMEKKRDRYKLDDSGSGCRYWCQIVLGDLEDGGFVTPGTTAQFLTTIDALAAKNPEGFPLPVRKGTFY
ncbi:hypothetical protein BD410DRAFT_427820 [Rickenella mellea]|uniref:DUF7770 domain-containing protein n=1 Tax=Rickenella mellea TaxID=50990 RepID=A0A4Y7QJP5_9AGAM|nr:hypothetical protein BD410DRAFT_427820 [Rickenella mellea]